MPYPELPNIEDKEFSTPTAEKLIPNQRSAHRPRILLLLHIPAHRDRPFRLNVTACSGRS